MKAKIGISIIVLAFIASLNPYLLVFTIPVFIVGVVLLWFSNKKKLTKILWTILPLAIWYPLFLISIYLTGTIGTATAQKLDFIFTQNFKGQAIVVSNIPGGQKILIKNNREILQIPANGILLYQGKIETGYINHKYYRLGSSGNLVDLPNLANYMFWDEGKNKPKSNLVGVFIGGGGTKTVLEPKPEIEYESLGLVVSSNDSIAIYSEFNYNKNFENQVDSLVRDCKVKSLKTEVSLNNKSKK